MSIRPPKQLVSQQVPDEGLRINRVVFSPSRDVLCGADGTFETSGYVATWDSRTLERLSLVHTHSPLANVLAFSRDGATLATSGLLDDKVELWDTNTWVRKTVLDIIPRNPPLLPHGLPREATSLQSMHFSGDGNRLVGGGGDMQVKVWQLNERVLRELRPLHRHNIQLVGFMPRPGYLLSADDQTIRHWNLTTGECVDVVQFVEEGSWWNHVATADLSMLVSVSHTGLVRLWDLVNSSHSDHEVKFKGTVRCIDVSSQSGLLAIGLVDGRIILWNVKTRKHLGRLRLYRDPVMSLAISPEGTSLACT